MHFDFSSIDSTVVYIKSFGVYGPLVALGLFFIQAVAPIIPYIILAGAAGMIYGTFIGFWLAYAGAMGGAYFLYWLIKRWGSVFFIGKLHSKYNFDINDIEEKHIFWFLCLCRIFPIVPTPLINIGAALGGVSTKIFVSSSAIGKAPWALIYVALGNYLMQSKNLTNTMIIIGIILLISLVGIRYFNKKMPNYRKSKS